MHQHGHILRSVKKHPQYIGRGLWTFEGASHFVQLLLGGGGGKKKYLGRLRRGKGDGQRLQNN